MIRPLTCICMLLAGGSGLYLYQSKHRAQMLDREIARTIKAADAARDRIGVLRGEWALLNEPERLSTLSQTHLGLKTLQPGQFAGLGDLAARLPAPSAVLVYATPDEPAPVAALPTAPASIAPKPAAPAPAPVQVAARTPPRVAPRPVQPASPVVAVAASAAPAPAGMSIGESVLRAARLRAERAGQPYSPPPYAQPSYAQPIYAQPVSAQPAYAPPSASALGNRVALPPPVPYASR